MGRAAVPKGHVERVADRLAETSVPIATGGNTIPTPHGMATVASADRRESSSREAVRLALRDRTLTSAERVHLHRLAEDLGIGGARAAEIQHEIETEHAEGVA